MIEYGQKPSNQAKITLEGDTIGETVLNLRQWVNENPKTWESYLSIVKAINKKGREASPNFCLSALRELHGVSVRNGYAPIFARLAKEQNPSLRFRMAKSQADGYFEVAL